MHGQIKFFDSDRGFGFIEPADRGADLFFHIKHTNCEESELTRGARVTFEIGEGRRGAEAQEVTLLIDQVIETGRPGLPYA